MVSSSGRYVIVYNGEIYNFRRLKNEIDSNYFKSISDTEVILELFEKFGIESISKLQEFTPLQFGIKRKKLILSRDKQE